MPPPLQKLAFFLVAQEFGCTGKAALTRGPNASKELLTSVVARLTDR